MFELVSKFKPSGDQPEAIKELTDGVNSGKKEQVLQEEKILKQREVPSLEVSHRQSCQELI